MKHPVGLTYPVGWPTGWLWGVATVGMCLTGATVFFVYTATLNPAAQWWRSAVVVTAWVLAIAGLWRHSRYPTLGHLRYDGERWWYQPIAPPGHAFVEQPVALRCVWDFQVGMWLAFTWDEVPVGSHLVRRYAWVQGRSCPLLWPAFRRALVFHERAQAVLGGGAAP